MLPRLTDSGEKNLKIKIEKRIGSRDVSALGAFGCGAKVTFDLSVPRELGANGAVMRICRDGFPDSDLPLQFCEKSDGITDIYSLTLDTAELCRGECSGLFYYEFLFLRGWDTLFSDTQNNLDIILSEREGCRFRLTVYKSDFDTPHWMHGGVMYHIFVDRFAKGSGDCALRDGQVYNPDWDNGIPQYAEIPGGFVRNNEFFGGNFAGICEKMDYLKSLGVTVLYLSPIFEAASNHKYDTGDYEKIDSAFGSEADFDRLLKTAEKNGIRVILDGVFNHTGDDSKYFNKRRRYPSVGAYNSELSEYENWYNFKSWPDEYETWWGVPILPKLNHSCDACREYFAGSEGIASEYIKRGASGWRLDVADELSDGFLDELRASVKAQNPDAVIIGEVWENAADKIAYGSRRRYLQGRQLDSVMNYPLRQGILSFVQYRDAEILGDVLKELYSSYPKCVSDSLMNLLGTHDTVRIFTLLGAGEEEGDCPNRELAVSRLDGEQRETALRLQKLCAALQFTVFGIPSVFYGDEVCAEGWRDPFCRRPFQWRGINDGYRAEMLEFYRLLGKIRAENPEFDGGDFNVEYAEGTLLVFNRENAGRQIKISANSGEVPVEYKLDNKYIDLISGDTYAGSVTVGRENVKILRRIDK